MTSSSASARSSATISGCIACGGANGTHVIAGAAVAAGGKPTPAPIMTRVMLFDTEAARTAFATSVKGTRTQLVVALPAKAGFDVAGVRGARVDVLAYRVLTPCDGKIVLAEPASSPVAPDPKACAK
ncbi:MAG: hypothetical protein NT062_13950 [Proteobacteria bacterium]|nr:hypothetical protein [Pseudomonadota bacterium]